VATKKKDIGCNSQAWPWKSRPSLLSRSLTTPYWVSNSHCHTVRVATTGIAQASSRPLWTRSMTGLDMCRIRRARPRPRARVTTALTAQKARDRPTTVQR
jgi:hypothetical protein